VGCGARVCIRIARTALSTGVQFAVGVAVVIADGDGNSSSLDDESDKHPAGENGGGGAVDMTFCYHDEGRYLQRTTSYMERNSRMCVRSFVRSDHLVI
jgi:hypothetical protein